ncbi:MAG: SpoIIE family protein phosphatase [Alphaproteobacteria bacterium]
MNFFRRYNRIVGSAYVVLLLVSAAFFYVQIEESYDRELLVIEDRLVDHGLVLDFITRATTSSVQSLQGWAEAAIVSPELRAGAGASPLFARLSDAADGGYFHLDDIGPPISQRQVGNLTGQGRLADLTPQARVEVEMALRLNDLFADTAEHLPNVAGAFYLSVRAFRNAYPWRPSTASRFQMAQLDQPFFRLGAPGVNKARTVYWTEPTPGDDRRELVVASAAPVYEDQDFRGVVGIELTLDYLNRVNANFDYDAGEVLVLASGGSDVLAHPDLLWQAMTERVAPDEVLDATRVRLLRKLLDGPARTMRDLGDVLAFHQGLEFAPWRLVYFVDKSEIVAALIWQRAPQLALLFVGLTVLLLVTVRLTRQEFIEPASKLVAHIDRHGTGEEIEMPRVPPGWRPWFAQISETFEENAELAGIRQELDVAHRMQLSILPTDFPDRPEMALFGQMRAAKSVGGDFYDFFELPDGRWGFVIADVSGKGVPAALFMMISRTLLKATALAVPAPGECARRVNDLLCQENDAMMFVTLFYGVLDAGTGELVYANAGHNPPCVMRSDGQVEMLPGTEGVALGVMDDLDYAESRMRLAPGDTLFCYTDGVTEAINPGQEEYAEHRLLGVLDGAGALSARDLANRVVDDVERFAESEPQADDITCLVLKYRPTAVASEAA